MDFCLFLVPYLLVPGAEPGVYPATTSPISEVDCSDVRASRKEKDPKEQFVLHVFMFFDDFFHLFSICFRSFVQISHPSSQALGLGPGDRAQARARGLRRRMRNLCVCVCVFFNWFSTRL